jgi:hypothetical protein
MAEKSTLDDLIDASKKVTGAAQSIFGSEPANEMTKAKEVAYWNQLNGSGPVNQQAALDAPKSWVDLIFGTRTNADDAAKAAPPNSRILLLILLAVVAFIAWKKF